MRLKFNIFLKQRDKIIGFASIMIFIISAFIGHANEAWYSDEFFAYEFITSVMGWIMILSGAVAYYFLVRAYSKPTADHSEVVIGQGLFPRSTSNVLMGILAIASFLLVYGVLADIIRIKKFIYIKDSYSVIGGIVTLFKTGNAIIGIIVAIFGVFVPALKAVLIFRVLSLHDSGRKKLARYIRLIHKYSRWSFLDVLVVAILVATVKLGALVTVETQNGLYAFLSAAILLVLLTMIVTWQMERKVATDD